MKTLMALRSSTSDSWVLTKKKIKLCVVAYKRRYPDAYKIVTDAIQMKRGLNRDQYASIESSEMRGLYEIPEDLHQAFVMALDAEEITWFKTKDGGRWFARTFPQFALPEKGNV